MYDLNSSVLSKSGMDPSELDNNLLRGLKGLAIDFLAMENKYGINALFAAAHAADESAWGTSEIALSKHNLFGLAAFDSNPGEAYTFTSFANCIDYYGQFLKYYYLIPGGLYYNGDTIHDVFVMYSTSHDKEAETVVEIMNQLSAGSTSPNPPSNQYSEYTVVKGDTLSGIAFRFNTSVSAIMALNPIIKNPNEIDIGWVLKIPMAPVVVNVPPAPPSPVPEPIHVLHTVVKGDTLSQLALTYHTSVAVLMRLNPIIKNPDVIDVGWILKMN